MDHSATIDNNRRLERIKDASTPDEISLVDVETAVAASQEQLAADAADYNDQVSRNRITTTVAQERTAIRNSKAATDFQPGKNQAAHVDGKTTTGHASTPARPAITWTQLVDMRGNPLTLKQLEERFKN